MSTFHKIRRSWLLTPMSEPEHIAAARRSAADVIVLDLVEFVAEGGKPASRDAVPEAIGEVKGGGVEVFVHVDPELLLADLRAAIWPGVDGVVVSRAESAQQIKQADALISQLEGQRGILPGSVGIVASLETALGNHNGYEIAGASPRVWGITLGRADLVMDLRPEPSGEIHLMQYLMQRLIIIASATGKAPLGAWWRAPDRGLLATPENTRAAARRGRAIGFQGSFCVLENQAAPLNDGFTPDATEVAAARGLCEAYAAAIQSGTVAVAAVEAPDLRILTPDLARQAANVLALADACASCERFKDAAREGRPIPLP